MLSNKWKRKEIVDASKRLLKGNYWNLLLITIICSILYIIQQIYNYFNPHATAIITLISFFITFLVLQPLICGKARCFILASQGTHSNIFDLFYFFSHDYWNIVKIMFIMNLKIVLWALLFIIPGVIKAYEYQMIPYILAEQSNISLQDAFKESKKMTDNQKLDMFILDLSLIGWYFIGVITIIGVLFINPYIDGIYVSLYNKFKELMNQDSYVENIN